MKRRFTVGLQLVKRTPESFDRFDAGTTFHYELGPVITVPISVSVMLSDSHQQQLDMSRSSNRHIVFLKAVSQMKRDAAWQRQYPRKLYDPCGYTFINEMKARNSNGT